MVKKMKKWPNPCERPVHINSKIASETEKNGAPNPHTFDVGAGGTHFSHQPIQVRWLKPNYSTPSRPLIFPQPYLVIIPTVEIVSKIWDAH